MRAAATYFKYIYYLTHYCGVQKISNFILNKWEKKFRKTYLRSLPVNITIEPGNICNLNCPGCVTGVSHPDAVEPNMLDFAQFKYIFDQMKDICFSISLYNWGEPFLNKDIFLMIRYASTNRCGTTIHSNFNVFDESMAEQAIESKLTHIYLSIDGATQKTYAEYRRGGDLAHVLKNIAILVNKKRELKTKFPLLTWKYLVFPHNAKEIKQAYLTSKELGVDAFEVFPANLDNLATFGTVRFYDLASGNIKTHNARTCDSLWDTLIIYPDGSVLPCCQAFRKKDIFGNIYQEPLRKIWNNHDFLTLRKMIKTRKIEQPIRYPCCECEVMRDYHYNFKAIKSDRAARANKAKGLIGL